MFPHPLKSRLPFALLSILLAAAVTVGYDEQAMAQVPCNQDDAIHIPPNYQHFLPPPDKVPPNDVYTDQTYCRTIKRLSISTNPGGPSTSDFITAEYATQNHFNADGTKIRVVFQGRDKDGFNKNDIQIIDLNGNLRCDLPTVTNSNEARWSRTDPDVLYFHRNNELRKANVASCTEDLAPVHVFSEYSTIYGTGESDISPNGDHFVFVGLIGDVPVDVFVYTISTDTKGAALNIATASLDWAHVTDNFVVLGFYHFPALAGGPSVRVYDHTMAFQRELTQYIGHEDVGFDSVGNEVLYLSTAGNTTDCQNSVEKWRLVDGTRTCLKTGTPAFDWSLAPHIAAPSQAPAVGSPAWVYISTYDGSDPNPDLGQWKPYTNEVLRIRDDGSGTIERLAHHYSRPFPNNTYYWTPRASVNRDGAKVLFSSTYGLHYKAADCLCTVAVQYTDTYLLTP